MVEKIARLEKESETSKVDMEKKEKNLKIAESENAQLSADVEEKAAHINTIETAHDALQIQHRKLEDDFEKCVLHGERTSHQLADTEVRLLQIIDYVAAFDTEKAVMENKIAEDAHQIKQLEARLGGGLPQNRGGAPQG
jgi:chromosome segregation ATPase